METKTLKQINAQFKQYGIACVSDIYINSYSKLQWVCSKNHRWQATYSRMCERVHKCTPCASFPNKKLTLNEIQLLAKEHGGELLSKTYKGNHLKLEWKCKDGHVFSMRVKNVKKGEWCTICSGRYIKFTPKELNEIANKKNGKCLTTKKLNIGEKALWECANGHQWKAVVYNVVKNNSWCPTCKNSIGESICRYIFESLTQKDFPSKRPKWLRNANQKKSMELDGFNEELKIAFEHQGRQHFGKTNTIFDGNTIKNDVEKRKICESKNIKLLKIKEIGFYISPEEALMQIRSFLINNNIEIKKNVNSHDIDNIEATLSKHTISELSEIANAKGGKCLSSVYLGHVVPLKWECKEGHVWEARPNDIKRGHWCGICAGKKIDIDTINKRMKSFGILCTSDTYYNEKGLLNWRCSYGHVFKDSWARVTKRSNKCLKCIQKN
jgi:hypothetical protein